MAETLWPSLHSVALYVVFLLLCIVQSPCVQCLFIIITHGLGVQNTDVYSESFTSSAVDLGPLSGVRSAPLTTEGAASSCVCLLRIAQSLWLCSAVELPRSTALTCRRQNPNRYSVGSFKTPTGFWPHGFDEAKTGTFVFSPA